MNFNSRHIEEAINQLAKLPGVGRKTAARFALHLLKADNREVEAFVNSIVEMKNELKYCNVCHNISDKETCGICSNPDRDRSMVCVVEDIRDVMAIEATRQYRGLYHVLGGIISPIDGIGPQDLTIDSLIDRIKQGEIKEAILALSTTMEGETTHFYIYRRLKEHPVSISALSRGLAVGDALEYADEITLGRSIRNRIPYESVLPAR